MINKFELDFLGAYYAATVTEEISGVFSLSVHLKEELQLEALKQAMERVAERFRFLRGHLRPNFFNYDYEITKAPIPFIPKEKVTELERNHQVFKVVYGNQDFTLKVNHILCDGRTLAKVAQALLICYFENLGVKFDEEKYKILNEKPHPEELENAFLKYLNIKAQPPKETSHQRIAYRPVVAKHSPIQMMSYQLSMRAVKERAKLHQATISEFLLALIFKSAREERKRFKSTQPFVAFVPIDCRSFFPSKTMRNFITAENIAMPEVEDLDLMIKKLHTEFGKINAQSVYQGFAPLQKTYQAVRYLPRFIKDWYMRRAGNAKSKDYTTGFSNIGKIDLPEKILNEIDFMEFFAETDGISPYYFSAVTVGEILTLSVTLKVDDDTVKKALEMNLEPLIFNYITHNEEL